MQHGSDQDEDTPLGLDPEEYSIYNELQGEYRTCEEGYLDMCDGYAERRSALRDPELEECDFSYCADFLREPRTNPYYKERPCAKGERCMGVILAANYPEPIETTQPSDGFICREWLLPSEQRKVQGSGLLPEDTKLCLLDNLALMGFLYHKHVYRGTEPVPCIQTHCNKVDSEGNYRLDCCYQPNPRKKRYSGIVRPIIKFAPNHYTYDTTTVEGEDRPLKCVHERRVVFH